MRALPALTACAALAALVASCGSARRGEPITGGLALTPAERRGRVVFMRHCHACHPGGEAGLGPALNDKPLPEALIGAQVRRGFGAMPAFPEALLGGAELADLVSFVVALRRAETR